MRVGHSDAGGRNKENDNFFYQLALANLVDSSFPTGYQGEGNLVYYTEEEFNQRFPLAKAPTTNKAHILPTYFGVQTCVSADFEDFREGGNGFMLAHMNFNNNQFRNTILPRHAANIDAKIDDGKPRSGNVGNSPLGNNFGVALTVSETYAGSACSSSGEYPVTNDAYQNNGFYGCRLTFLNRF